MPRFHRTARGLIPFTPGEEAEFDAKDAAGEVQRQESKQKLEQEAAKLAGIEINGVMCSATKDDQTGLVAVERFFNLSRSAGVTPAPTVFRFANGNTLEITDVNFDAIYAAWVSFRQSFFVERS